MKSNTFKHYGAPPVKKEKYTDPETDSVDLEDESGRLHLKGDLVKSELLVTGTVVAVLGTEGSEGDFHVMDIKLPGYAPQKPKGNGSGYVALVSGIAINGERDRYEIELLEEYLSGELGGQNDRKLVSQVSHLILAGDSVTDFISKEDDANTASATSKNTKYRYGADNSTFHPEPMVRLDEVVANLAKTVPVSIMPGKLDPVTSSLPQQPFHQALFTSARPLIQSKIVTTTTDPYWWDLDGVRIFGSSGQTIDDIYKYVAGDDRVNMINHTLLWRHCAPTAPDTLWSYPFQDNDPFILNETPHIYFVGNQPKFETVHIREGDTEVRIIALPKFSETGQFVLVDLETLDTKLISIGTAS
ncbi:Pol31p [Sugiyamaella lignohabitans]|uniref:Pol31p n=1 Tax=Sugiyamaella lignohabitans TaxID=796027 RepID=A0A167DB30_9ASCO|nr:Pol31p [Sugiyamaella lignohabitans]ANB12700.1 Pol31p [Sugiyamaella lignohabitans]